MRKPSRLKQERRPTPDFIREALEQMLDELAKGDVYMKMAYRARGV